MRRLILRLAAIACIVGPLAAPAPAAASWYSGLYVFGDSLSDRGNLFALTGGAVPVAPTYAAGQFSNGPSWSAPFAARLGLPSVPSLAGGNVYAYGLARSDNVAPGLGLPGFINLPGQVDAFLAGPAAPAGALFAVWSGANNLLQAMAALPLVPDPVAFLQAEAVAAAVGVLTELARLRQDGATTFLVLNQPNLGLIPRFNGDALLSSLAELASVTFNTVLAGGLAAGLGADPQVRLFTLDTFGLFEKVVAAPAGFGFTNVTGACVTGAVPDIYVNPLAATQNCTPAQAETTLFWDPVHPTAAAHAVIAAAALVEVPAPGGFGLLLVGLAGMAALRRRAAG
jgi:outer membrane lipase/esterase